MLTLKYVDVLDRPERYASHRAAKPTETLATRIEIEPIM
jgi:hypothetical protein